MNNTGERKPHSHNYGSMDDQAKKLILYSALLLMGLCAFFWGVVAAKPFLAPVAIATLLTMLVLPICVTLERKGLKRGWAALVAVLIILIFLGAFTAVLGMQARSIGREWPAVKERLRPQIEHLQQELELNTGITVEQQNEELVIDEVIGDDSASNVVAKGAETQEDLSPAANGSKVLSSAGDVIWEALQFLGKAVVVLIYVFFFLLYRQKFSNTLLMLVPKEEQAQAREAMDRSGKVSQNYLLGKLILIICLTILYSIGLYISGVDHALLIAVISAFLSLMPYIGNAIGLLLSICMVFFSGGDAMGVLGVVVTFLVAQFIESYMLEPYVVGDRVDLNPVVVIMAVMLGGAVWGVVGMVIAIPTLGIVKVVCDQVPVLQPFAYLFGQATEGKRKRGFMLPRKK